MRAPPREPSPRFVPGDPFCSPATVWTVRCCAALGLIGVWASILLDRPIGVPLVVGAFLGAFVTTLRAQWTSQGRIAQQSAGRCVACWYDLSGLKPGTPCPECGNTRLFRECPPCTHD